MMSHEDQAYDSDATISAPPSTTRATFATNQPRDLATVNQAEISGHIPISDQPEQLRVAQALQQVVDQPLLPEVTVEELDGLLLNYAICMGLPASNNREWNEKDPQCALQDFMAIFNKWHSINQVHLTTDLNFARVNGVNIGAKLSKRAIDKGRAHLLMPVAEYLDIMADDRKKKVVELHRKEIMDYREFDAASNLYMWSMDRRFYEAASLEVVRAARQESLRQYKLDNLEHGSSSSARSAGNALPQEAPDDYIRGGGAAGRIQSMILAQNRFAVAKGRPKAGEAFMAAMEVGKGKPQDNDGNQCIVQ